MAFDNISIFICDDIYNYVIILFYYRYFTYKLTCFALRKQPPDLKLVSALMGKHTVSLIADPGL